MAKYEIVIDNVAVFCGEHDERAVLPISYNVKGKTLEADNLDIALLREAHKNGLNVRSQITPKDSTLALEKLLEEGNDLLILSVTSGLSESFSTANYIAKGLRIKHPSRKIVVLDTLSCGSGEGLLYSLAKAWQKEGLELDQVAQNLKDAIKRLHHVFITDDAIMLANAGIIPTTALNIKPIFDIASNGHVCVLQKTMGKKKALGDIVKYVASTLDKEFCPQVVISYGNEPDARALGENVSKLLPDAKLSYADENVFVSAYLGDNSVSICFFGEARK